MYVQCAIYMYMYMNTCAPVLLRKSIICLLPYTKFVTMVKKLGKASATSCAVPYHCTIQLVSLTIPLPSPALHGCDAIRLPAIHPALGKGAVWFTRRTIYHPIWFQPASIHPFITTANPCTRQQDYKLTLRERWCLTDLREPTTMGPRAIKNRLK